MNRFVRNLLTEWRKLALPFENQTIITAVSGGADSVSLILALHDLKQRKKLNLRLIVAHFNHNLRGAESEKDAEFVKDLAKKLEIEFVQQSPESKIEDQKGNLEQNARDARYNFFSNIAARYDAFAVLIAHTQNDQAETLLLNLIRGSGLDGLAGIRCVRKQTIKKENQNFEFFYIRPLLDWAKRADTEKYCVENQIQFRNDEMNDDLKFSRVKIRKEIIPLLQKLNPQLIDKLSNTAVILRNDAEELSKVSLKWSKNISQKSLKGLSKAMRMRVLRNWLEAERGSLRQIDLKHLEAIERLISSRKSGKFIELPNGEKVIKSEGNIVFEKSRVEKSRSDY